MATGLLMLNDVAVTLLDVRKVVGRSPGVITRTDQGLVTGDEALALARRYPTDTSTDFWYRLGTERATSHGHTYADLAFAHLQAMLDAAESSIDALVIVAPSSMSREQLGLLLGITTKLDVSVRGLLDASVFCGARPAPGRKLMFLQLQRHQLLMAGLEQGRMLTLDRVDRDARLGLSRLYEAWAEAVADAFVRKTRFDPMHSAATEQQIYDRLDGWIDELGNELAVPLSLERDGETITAELRRDALLAATGEHYRRLVDDIESRREGAPLSLVIDEHLARLPGLSSLLGSIADAELQFVSIDDTRHVIVDTRQSWVGKDGEPLKLIRSIPWSTEAEAAQPAPTANGLAPTHLLHDGHAWPVAETPMTVGLDEADRQPGPRLARRYPGVSRRHFSVQRKGEEIWLEDLSRYGTFVNGERVAGTRRLRVGDDVRIGNPGAHFQLIRVARDGT